MKFNIYFHHYPLSIAIENGNIEIIKLLLANKDIDININIINIKNKKFSNNIFREIIK